MFQKSYRLSAFLLSIFLFHTVVQAAAPQPSAYPYQASLKAGPVKIQQRVEAKLPSKIIHFIRPDFGNVQVLDDRNDQPEFVIFTEPIERAGAINTVELSSENEESDPTYLFDNNRLTTFVFKNRIEAHQPDTILIDFGKLVELHRIEIWPTFQSDIKGMELRAGNSKENLKTLKRRTEFNSVIDGDYAPLRWLEISLWGVNVVLEDLNFFKKSQTTVYFTAEPERRYRLLYGDMNLDNKRFSQRVSSPQNFDQQFSFSTPQFNALAATDFDGDGIPNQTDNCPLIRNQSQTDQDADRIGDACDNAVEVKNFSQIDVDRDGVGDIIDNCKLEANPDQKDRDNDGSGDICDNAYAKESVFEKWTGGVDNISGGGLVPFGLVGGLLALVAVAVIGISVGRKK